MGKTDVNPKNSALEQGWYHPVPGTVVKVRDHARKLAQKRKEVGHPVTKSEMEFRPALKTARLHGQVEGMALALAILRKTSAREELKGLLDE